MNHAVVLLAAVALSSSAPAFAAPIATCPNDHGMVSVVDVETAFARRSVEIVTLAGKADDAALSSLVSPKADFALWSGDVSWAPRGGQSGREDLVGIPAARAFARQLAATRFEFAVDAPSMIAVNPCDKQSVTVTFAHGVGDRAFIVRFDYLAGRLIRADGREVALTRGTIEVAR